MLLVIEEFRNNVRQTTPPSRGDLLVLLTEEIADLERSKTRPGWTTWAILGALATLIWVLLNSVDNHEIDALVVLKFLLLIITICDCLWIIWKTLSSIRESDRTSRFEVANKAASDIWRVSFPLLIRNGTIFYLIVYASFPTLQTILLVVFFSMETVVLLSALLMSFFPFPLPSKPQPRSLLKVAVIAVFITSIAVRSLWVLILHKAPSVTEWKVALISTSCIYLCILLMRASSGLGLIVELKEIRRRLVLGELSPSDAAKQIDLVIRGLTVHEILQPAVANVLATHSRVISRCRYIEATLRLIKEITERLSLEDKTETEARVKSLIISIKNNAEILEEIINDQIVAEKTLERRIHLLRGMSKSVIEEVHIILNQVSASRQRVVQTVKNIKNTITQLDQIENAQENTGR